MNFKKEGICNLDELELFLQDLLQCVIIARKSNNEELLDQYIDIRKLNLNYKNNYYMSEIEYSIKVKLEQDETDEERTFKEAT